MSYIMMGFIALILLLGAAVGVQSVRLSGAQAELKGAQDSLVAEQKANDLLNQDVVRQQAAVKQRDTEINDLTAQLTQLRADAVKADQVADQVAADHQKQVQSLAEQLARMKGRANAHPEDVRPLGPIVSDVLDSMCGGAGQLKIDPAATCH